MQQFVHGTQYIDELVMMRRKAERSEGEPPAIGKVSKDARVRATTCPQQTSTKRVRGGKGDLYVHQVANWNVIGLTDRAAPSSNDSSTPPMANSPSTRTRPTATATETKM